MNRAIKIKNFLYLIKNSSEDFSDKEKYSWTPEYLDEDDWSSHTETNPSIDIQDIRRKVERHIAKMDKKELESYSPEDLEKLKLQFMDNLMKGRRKKLEEYHYQAATGKSLDMIPTEEARKKGLERLKTDRPEMFDPSMEAMEKGWRRTYIPFSDYSETYGESSMKKDLNKAIIEYKYNINLLDSAIARKLHLIIADNLVGKTFKIFVGSPTLPKYEDVIIDNVYPYEQKIIFKSPGGDRYKYVTSYDDFFYHKKVDGLPDGERILKSINPNLSIPKKGFVESVKSLFRI